MVTSGDTRLFDLFVNALLGVTDNLMILVVVFIIM